MNISLKTPDLHEAEAKTTTLERELNTMWQARLAAENPDYQAIVEDCQSMGFAYHPLELQNDQEFLRRASQISPADHTQAKALLGIVAPPDLLVSQMPSIYEALSAYRLTKKNDEQRRIWRRPFNRAKDIYVQVCGDTRMTEISPCETQMLREHLRTQVAEGKIVPNTANLMIGSLQTMFKEICLDKKLTLENPFTGMRLKESKTKGRRKAVPEGHIWAMLQPGTLDQMNDEARDILHISINTGCRPSEICGVLPHLIHLDAPGPYFNLEEEGRELKTGASIRPVVLLGIAQDAMQRRLAAGGFPRYNGKHNSLSTALNEFLHDNALLSREHTLYGLRHAFQDRVTSQNLTERISAELMGHEVRCERYSATFRLLHSQSPAQRRELKSLPFSPLRGSIPSSRHSRGSWMCPTRPTLDLSRYSPINVGVCT